MNTFVPSSTTDDLALTTDASWFVLWSFIASPIFKMIARTVPVGYDLYSTLWQLRMVSKASPGAFERTTKLQDILRSTRTRLVALYEMVKTSEEDVVGTVDPNIAHLDISHEEKLENLIKSLRKRIKQLNVYLGQGQSELALRDRELSVEAFVFLTNAVHQAEEDAKKGMPRYHFVRYRGQTALATDAEVFEVARILYGSEFRVSSDVFACHKPFIVDFLNNLLQTPIDELRFKASGRSDAPSTTSSDSTSTSRAKYDGFRSKGHTPSSSVDSSSSVRVRFDEAKLERRAHRNSSSGDARPQIIAAAQPHGVDNIQPPSRSSSRQHRQSRRLSNDPNQARPTMHAYQEQPANKSRTSPPRVEYTFPTEQQAQPRYTPGLEGRDPQVAYASGHARKYKEYTIPVGGSQRLSEEEERARHARGIKVEEGRAARRERRQSMHRENRPA